MIDVKSKIGKYWIIISFCIIANIFIFIFLSNKLEKYVYDSMTMDQTIANNDI